MLLVNLTIEMVRCELDAPIPELYLVIAKHLVLGMESVDIGKALGFEAEEIDEIRVDELFVAVEAIVRSAYADAEAAADISWDGLEQIALRNLGQSLLTNVDPDLSLRVATAANKAARRHRSFAHPLNGTNVAKSVRVTVTDRLMRRFLVDESGGVQSTLREGPIALPRNNGSGVESNAFSVAGLDSTPPKDNQIDDFLGMNDPANAQIITSIRQVEIKVEEDTGW